MAVKEDLIKRINRISKETAVPVKKIMDLLFFLQTGKPVENNELMQRVGVSKNALNQVKTQLFFLLKPPSKNTQLNESSIKEIKLILGPDYKPEEALWTAFKDSSFAKSVGLLKKYAGQMPTPERKYDQFSATPETTAKRASLLNFFEDIGNKKLLFLGDDDLTSIAVASLHSAADVTVLDIDVRILDKINSISKREGLHINTGSYDARKPLPESFANKYDTVFTDPPYTVSGIKLFVSRAVQTLAPSNQTSRIYICYGNSDRAKERFLPIYEVFSASGLMMRWVFDKFNRYIGSESIGNSSSLFILEKTAKTKPLIAGFYDKPIYTDN